MRHERMADWAATIGMIALIVIGCVAIVLICAGMQTAHDAVRP